MDTIRILRIIEYVGTREAVEEQIRLSLHGSREGVRGCKITATTLGTFPEILAREEQGDAD
jgi:hypothetical protein